jgi:DNA-directed RNA polymerase subunit omega
LARITVEDSLKKVPSRFSLVHVSSQRARHLLKGVKPLVESSNRVVVTALREIAAGRVRVVEVDESAEAKEAVKE